MNITYVGRKVNLKDSFKERAEKKLKKLERFFGNEAFIKITVTVEKDRQTVEITVKYKGFYFRSESTAAEMETALDLAI